MKSVVFFLCVVLQGVSCSLPYFLAPTLNDVSSACKIQSDVYARSLKNLTQWAMQMYDASVKIPHGILVANTYHFGNFDECLNVRVQLGPEYGGKLTGQYCLLRVQVGTDEPYDPPRLEMETDPFENVWKKIKPSGEITLWKRNILHWGVCVPASCTPEDVKISADELVEKLNLTDQIQVNVDPALCQTKNSIKEYQTLGFMDYFVKFVFGGLAAIVVASTIYDYYYYRLANEVKTGGTREKLLLCFSARKNIPDILMPENTSPFLDVIYGGRTAFTILVVYGHRWRLLMTSPLHESFTLEKKAREFNFLTTSLIIVNTFFCISGFVTGYFFYSEISKRDSIKKLKPSIILHSLVYRVLRFTPVYVAVILISLTFVPKMSDGPLWPISVGAEASRCRSTWWTNLLYINNYYMPDKMCLYQSWYLSTDIQLFCLAMVLLYILKRNAKIGYMLFGVTIFGSILWHGLQLYIRNDLPFLSVDEQNMKSIPNSYQYINYYIPSHFRAAPYMISTFAGFLLYKWNGFPFEMSEISSNILALLIVILMVLVKITGLLWVDPYNIFRRHRLLSALYGSTRSSLWSLGTSVIMVLFLSTRISWADLMFTSYPLLLIKKLCYCIYLIHTIIHSIELGSMRTPQTSSRLSEYWMTAGDIIFSSVFAFILCVLVEMPSSKLVKYLFESKRNISMSNVAETKIIPETKSSETIGSKKHE